MGKLLDEFRCHCQIPVPLIDHDKEDTGLCQTCTMVYDEGRYTMMSRRNLDIWEENEDLDDFLTRVVPRYAQLKGRV